VPQPQGSTRPIEVAVGGWTFTFAVDAEPTTGELRSFSETVADVAGLDRDVALAAVVAAIVPSVDVFEAAA